MLKKPMGYVILNTVVSAHRRGGRSIREDGDTVAEERISENAAHVTAYGSAAMAYFGDAVFELLVRRRLIETGISDAGKLNRLAAEYVRAGAQSKAMGRIEGCLSELELAEYKRGRNASGLKVPKSARAVEYRRATGLEVLFAGLFLRGEYDRIDELFGIAFPPGGDGTDGAEPDGDNSSNKI